MSTRNTFSRASGRRAPEASAFKIGGFTLIELMIAVVIVCILAAIALPAYDRFVAKGRRADAINALTGLMQAQERFRSNKNRYASSFEELLPYAASPKHYTLSMVGAGATPSYQLGFKVTATPTAGGLQAKDTDCASMSIRVEYGNVYYEASNGSGTAANDQCWPK